MVATATARVLPLGVRPIVCVSKGTSGYVALRANRRTHALSRRAGCILR